ncbi:hypothetical protein HOY82DRAFT_358990 [Tuber indicum]|nr:hypothetical protein HOY82DRAFT_358990 [Tuber indicum]
MVPAAHYLGGILLLGDKYGYLSGNIFSEIINRRSILGIRSFYRWMHAIIALCPSSWWLVLGIIIGEYHSMEIPIIVYLFPCASPPNSLEAAFVTCH